MGNLLDMLRLGGNALGAQQVSAQITGSNITNAQTPGYHRQNAAFRPMPGTGLRDVRIERATNQLLEQQLDAQRSATSFSQSRTDGLSMVVAAVGDFSEQGVGGALNDFFNAWRDLSAQPTDLSVRAEVISRSELLVNRFHDAQDHLKSAGRMADDALVGGLAEANDMLAQVAELNIAIRGSLDPAAPPTGLMDERDGLVSRLAELAGTKSIGEGDGTLSVLLGGISVVSGERAYKLEAKISPTQGYHDITVAGTTQGVINKVITGGRMGAHLALRDGDIAEAQAGLDQLAFDAATAINAVHSAGFALDGTTGRDLFAVPATPQGASAGLAVDPTVLGSPELLAASESATAPGSNKAALSLIDVESAKVSAGGTQTLNTSVQRLVSLSGRALSESRVQGEQAQHFLTQTQSLWEQQHGVSLDEQMLQLSRIQNAYQAAAKLIDTVDRMLDVLQRL